MDNMTLLQALEYARSRHVILPAEFYSLDLNSRQYASTVSGLASLNQIKSVLNSVYSVVESGGTFQDFQKMIEAEGIDLSEAQLKNVFRTNTQNAYGYGRWLHQQRNKGKRPYLMMMVINDKRTRPTHSMLDRIIRHIDDPFWRRYYPPWAFMCRCTVIALTEKQAMKYGITPDDELPDLPKDDGFSFDPWNYDQQSIEVLRNRLSGSAITPEFRREIERLSNEAAIDVEAIKQIKTSLSDLTDEKQVIIDEMVDKAVRLDPNIRPSDLRITLDLADEKENALTTILKQAELQKDQDGTAGQSIWDKVIGAFNRLFTLAKNTASKLTGNSIRGIDGLSLTEGSVIGIQTPTLFKQAQKAGKQITILDAKGIAIDLNKISGLNGALLAPDLNLEVVSITDDLLVLKRTDQKASRYFVADQTVISLY